MPRISNAASKSIRGLPRSTFVLDNGAYSMKAGFAPADTTDDVDTLGGCHTIANALARTRDKKTYVAGQIEDQISQWSEATFRRPVENGQVVSWEAEKEIWEYSFFDEATAARDVYIGQPEDTTLILSEAPNTMPALQKNADEIIMEGWGFGGLLRTVAGSLDAYNNLHPLFEENAITESSEDRPMECLLVIDSGYSHTIVTPLFNGRPIQRAIRRLDFGGKHLTNLLKEVISVRHFDLHQDIKIVNDIKEDVCFVSNEFKADLEETWKGNRKPKANDRLFDETWDEDVMDVDNKARMRNLRVDYILPDSIHVLRGFARPHDPSAASARKRKHNAASPESSEISMTLGNERFTVPEIIFSPSDIGSKQPGLADCIMQSMSVLPPLVQATMLANTLVVGGNAKLPGFVERLQGELRCLVRSDWTVRVRKMTDPIKSTWLGGARMASRHTEVVQEYGVTKEEYYEHGSAWMTRKFAGQAR